MDHLRLTEALQRVLSAPHYAHIRDLARNLATDLAPLIAEAEAEEIARLRADVAKFGDHLFVDAEGVVFDFEKGHASRYQDFLRCPDRWATRCACGFDAARNP